ncbi:hypothetical protein F5X96DRAFT_654419 [Biscogniauxia mediterranea]|nr:hypothetical protein F5X96DRAFT_654419 [Biscogniauxia mediterranea]
MIITDLFSIILRLAELAFAAIVAGINGEYLHWVRHTSSWHQGRFIYTEVVAGISLFLALIWLIPFSSSFIHWPIDLVIAICWFVAFGLLENVSTTYSSAFPPVSSYIRFDRKGGSKQIEL